MQEIKTIAQAYQQFSSGSSRQPTSLAASGQSSISRYDAEGQNQWLTRHNPSTQVDVCRSTADCYFGNHSTLAALNQKYGSETAAMWLVAQLLDLSEYAGAKDKISGNALSDCASIIAGEFYFLKYTEVMLFFYRFKSGYYGKFYGSVDPLTIMTALRTFVKERNAIIDRHESEQRRFQRQDSRRDAISHEQWMKEKSENAQKHI